MLTKPLELHVLAGLLHYFSIRERIDVYKTMGEAIRIAQQWLNAQGLEEIDVSQFANMIEAAYNELNNEMKSHMPGATMTTLTDTNDVKP